MKAGVAFVDPEIVQAAVYYRTYRYVPISLGSSVVAGNVYCRDEPFTLYNLVKGMQERVKQGDDLIIACHGNRRAISLRPGPGLWLDNAALKMMLNPDGDDALKLGIPMGGYVELLNNLEKIRKLKLDHIALRACRIGHDRTFLRNFARLFGARSISAPLCRTMYAQPTYYGTETQGSKSKAFFKTSYINYADVPLRYAPQKKVELGTKRIRHSKFYMGIMVENTATLRQFLSENMPDHATPTTEQDTLRESIPVHGFCVPGEPGKFYFAKDPRYAKNLTFDYADPQPVTGNPRNAMAAQ